MTPQEFGQRVAKALAQRPMTLAEMLIDFGIPDTSRAGYEQILETCVVNGQLAHVDRGMGVEYCLPRDAGWSKGSASAWQRVMGPTAIRVPGGASPSR